MQTVQVETEARRDDNEGQI